MTTSTLTTDMDGLKQTLQQIWTAGDYDRFHATWKVARANTTGCRSRLVQCCSTSGAGPANWR